VSPLGPGGCPVRPCRPGGPLLAMRAVGALRTLCTLSTAEEGQDSLLNQETGHHRAVAELVTNCLPA
jgi:hypothetical protein